VFAGAKLHVESRGETRDSDSRSEWCGVAGSFDVAAGQCGVRSLGRVDIQAGATSMVGIGPTQASQRFCTCCGASPSATHARRH
jgi:hypothetical protein